jgi:ADP-heptose:LPS heptosyltransferase
LKILFLGTGLPFVQIDKGRKEKKALTRWKHKTIEPLITTHERYAAVFQKLGYPVALTQNDTLPKIAPTKRIQELLGDGSKKVIGIAPYAAFKGKMYPLSLLKELLQLLDNTNKYIIVLLGGGPREARELNELGSRYANCINGAGFLSYSEELMLISNLDLVLSMDSGNAHLAAMFGVTTITLWGVTHPFAGFYPFQQHPANAFLADREQFPFIPTSVYGNKFPVGYEHAMDTISPNAVFLRIEAVLKPE